MTDRLRVHKREPTPACERASAQTNPTGALWLINYDVIHFQLFRGMPYSDLMLAQT